MESINPCIMPRIDERRLKHNIDNWKRTLVLMIDENIHLKNRLSQALRGKLRNELLLMQAENFQNSFERQDVLIGLLKNEIAEFDRLLVSDRMKDDLKEDTVEAKFKNISNDMNTAEQLFNVLKFEFNNYLGEAS